MKKIYIRGNTLQDEIGNNIDVHINTVHAAKRGIITKSLRMALHTALYEEIRIKPDEFGSMI